jgi:hypothetical protein
MALGQSPWAFTTDLDSPGGRQRSKPTAGKLGPVGAATGESQVEHHWETADQH